LCLGYNSTESFNDRRLTDMARSVPTGPPQLDPQNTSLQTSQDEGQQQEVAAAGIQDTLEDKTSSFQLLNTAVCEMQTPTTTNDNCTLDDDDKVPADDQQPDDNQVPAYNHL